MIELSIKQKKKLLDVSQKLVKDTRPLLWVVTVGGMLLAFYSIYKNFTGALPWISALVGLPWAAHSAICAAYLSLCKSDHKEGGITFESAKVKGFVKETDTGSQNSPSP